MPDNTLDYASHRTPPEKPNSDPLRMCPLVAALCAAFAFLKSRQFHSIGQLPHERSDTLFLVALSLPFLLLTVLRMPRYQKQGPEKLVAMILFCIAVVGCNAMAVWNLKTALGAPRDWLW